MKLQQIIFTVAFIVSCVSIGFAQTDREKGIELFNKGDFQGAVDVLNQVVKANENDVIAFYNLGLAYEKLKQNKDAVKSFGKAIKLVSEIINKAVLKAYGGKLSIENQSFLQDTLKNFSQDFESAYLSSAHFVSLKPKEVNSAEWRNKIELIEAFAPNSQISRSIFHEKELTTKVEILSQPGANGGEGIQGTVRLRILLLGNGEVGAVIPLNQIQVLTNNAYNAAKRIKFTPATKDGKNVSVWKTVEYRFSTY